MKYLVAGSLFVLLSNLLNGQEILSNLKTNPVLVNEALRQSGSSRSTVDDIDTLCLPFLDDFSARHIYLNDTNIVCTDSVDHISSGIFPASLYWTDSTAFINMTYPTLPPTYGVATLDGLNKFGQPYNETSEFAMADKLTSKPIYLSSVIDSVYLSFYYQPGGLGDFPNGNDSLILEFKNVDSNWVHIWHALNTTGDDPQSFKIVVIPVPVEYQFDGFQFRFRNWASVNGNNDHWHLDYVLLDDDRTFNDTLFRDVAIIYQPEPYLKKYREMPWNQFKDHQPEEINDTHGVFISNNYNTIINTAYQYEAFEKYENDVIIPLTDPISINFNPFSTQLISFNTFTLPPGIENYDEDSMVFSLKYILNPASDVNRRNDTLLFDQKFYNYFAYDDGTAEKAYALNGTGAKLAIRYFANEPDTIKEVYIHWSYVDGPNSNLFFSLMVWDDIDTTLASGSENIIFQNDFLSPNYVDSLNGFYVYKLVDFLGNPTPVVVNGYFYIGWLQTQDEFLNVGFDVNSDAHENVFFNVGGAWQKSSLPGAVMIRPQIGGDYSIYAGVDESDLTNETINVYPNPAIDNLYIDLPEFSELNFEIFDQHGRIVMSEEIASNLSIDISKLAAGFYVIKLREIYSGNTYYAKFVKGF